VQGPEFKPQHGKKKTEMLKEVKVLLGEMRKRCVCR
jgi:hypothetical protein